MSASLNGGYARRTNRRYGSRDHVFWRPFYSELIADDDHLREVLRYVVLNPVRGRLCREPARFPWSSYRATVGLDHAPSFLAVAELLGLFHSRAPAARAAYRRFVAGAPTATSRCRAP